MNRMRKIFGSEVSPKVVNDAATSASNTAKKAVSRGANKAPPVALTPEEKALKAIEQRLPKGITSSTPLAPSERSLLKRQAEIQAKIQAKAQQEAKALKAQEKRRAAELKTLEYHAKPPVLREKLPEGYAYRRVARGDYSKIQR